MDVFNVKDPSSNAPSAIILNDSYKQEQNPWSPAIPTFAIQKLVLNFYLNNVFPNKILVDLQILHFRNS